jgi:hypothetical protein
MGWLPRISRFGTLHAVFAQENPHDCGLACAKMVNFLIKKDRAESAQSLAASTLMGPVTGSRMADFYMDQARQALCDQDLMRRCGNSPSTCTYQGGSSNDAKQLASLMNQLGLGKWVGRKVKENDVDNAIVASRNRKPPWPIILGVAWDHGGGHWVVCDRYVDGPKGSRLALISDPYDGDVWPTELRKTEATPYMPGPSGGSWWGSVHYPYDFPARGRFDGYVVCPALD